jgi:hypothetical protein
MLKSIKLSKGDSNSTYTLRGMFYQKSEVKEREGEYDIILHYDVVTDGIREPLGFLYLSTKKSSTP